MQKVGAILIIYGFEKTALMSSLNALIRQTDCVCVVDNSTSDNSNLFAGNDKVVYFAQMHNTGIAAAQNVGIRYFMDHDFDFIIFADQDSCIPDTTVSDLLVSYNKLQNLGYKIGAVAPRACNKITGTAYPHQCNKIKEFVMPDGENITEVTFTMSSSSLVPVEMFRRVGLMDERLFIDGVDSEWCWRGAYAEHLRFFVDEGIHIKHLLGLGTKNIGGKSISLTPPYRMHYMYRNYLWLLHRKYVPKRWLVYNGMKYIAKIFYYLLFAKQCKEYMKFIFQGLHEGLTQYKSNS